MFVVSPEQYNIQNYSSSFINMWLAVEDRKGSVDHKMKFGLLFLIRLD